MTPAPLTQVEVVAVINQPGFGHRMPDGSIVWFPTANKKVAK